MENKSFVGMRGVLIEGSKVLLIRRVRDDNIYYVFPGGHISLGETHEECVVREMEEELSIKTNPINLIYTCTQNDETQGHYLMNRLEGPPQKTENADYQRGINNTMEPIWVSLDKLDALEGRGIVPLIIKNQLIIDINSKVDFTKSKTVDLFDE